MNERKVELNVTRRVRLPEKFMESESALPNQFQLAEEFTGKYEYWMKGRADEI